MRVTNLWFLSRNSIYFRSQSLFPFHLSTFMNRATYLLGSEVNMYLVFSRASNSAEQDRTFITYLEKPPACALSKPWAVDSFRFGYLSILCVSQVRFYCAHTQVSIVLRTRRERANEPRCMSHERCTLFELLVVTEIQLSLAFSVFG